jgi:ABC-type branched-subunit amino acid transport system substrate-binding protein
MAAPMRVGILDDMADGPPGVANIESWLRLAVDELAAAGRLDREVELVSAWGLGLPAGTAAAVERAYAALVEQDVLLIVGPAIGDNALVATPLAERRRVPTLNWAGSERARGEYMFHLQVGSHEDESVVLARHLAGRGAGRMGVVYDRSPIGRRHLEFLQAEAEVLGSRVAAAASVAPLAEQADAEAAEVLDARPDAILYLGLGVSAPAVARAFAARGWSGPCAMNTAGIRGYQPEFAEAVDGWTYVDMHSDRNATLAALRERLGAPPARALWAAKGYDLGRLVAEGLARAPERTREGVKDGLEQIKWLPAAEGHEGTLLGFGHHDRGALHGRYLVLRQWLGGQTVEVDA